MNDAHLTEAELLDVADGAASEAARAHAASCPQCGAAAAEAAHGRHLLRSAAPLEEPPPLAGAIAALPRRPRTRPGLLRIGAPAIAVAGATAAAVLLATGGGAPKQPSAGDALRGTSVAAKSEAAPAPLRAVAGPASAVAAALRHAGFKASVIGPAHVLVHGDPAAVARALARRPAGTVRIDVRP
jgi:hypothetical protein